MVNVGDFVHHTPGHGFGSIKDRLDWWCTSIEDGPYRVLAIEGDDCQIVCLEVISNIRGPRRWRVYSKYITFAHHSNDTGPITPIKKKERSW